MPPLIKMTCLADATDPGTFRTQRFYLKFILDFFLNPKNLIKQKQQRPEGLFGGCHCFYNLYPNHPFEKEKPFLADAIETENVGTRKLDLNLILGSSFWQDRFWRMPPFLSILSRPSFSEEPLWQMPPTLESFWPSSYLWNSYLNFP